MAPVEEDLGIPWRKIVIGTVIGAGVTVAAGGLVYLIYKKLGENGKSPSKDSKTPQVDGIPKASGPIGGTGNLMGNRNRTLATEATRLKDKGNELFKAGKYQEAIEMYTKALGIVPEANVQSAATFYQNRAAAYEKLDDAENVIKDCTSAIENNKTYAKAYSRRARAHEKMKKYKEALLDFTAGCVLEQFQNMTNLENADRVLKLLSEIKAKEAMDKRPADHRVPLSESFVDSYFLSFCEDPVLKMIPSEYRVSNGIENGELRGFDLVLKLLAEKRYEEASDAASEEIEKEGERVLEALLVRATFDLIRGRRQGTNDFEKLFDMFDKMPQDERILKIKTNALIKRGSLKMQQGKKEECFEHFDQAQQLDPQNADIYHHRGQLEMLMSEIDKAKENFAKCIELRPDFSVARVQGCYAEYRAASASQSTLAVTKAINKFEVTLREFPNCSEGYALLGQVYSERDALAEAEQMYDKALEINPKSANIYVHKGLLELQRSENFDQAREIMSKALVVDPNSEFAYETIGTMEVQRGNINEALQFFDKASDLARTELELTHIFSMKEAATAQLETFKSLGIQMPLPT